MNNASIVRKVVTAIFLIIGCCGASVEAACLTGGNYHKVSLHLKRLNKAVVFDIPKSFEVQVFPDTNSFIINFSYPEFMPRPVNAPISQSSARLVIYGGAVGESMADWSLGHPPAVYKKTENGVMILKSPVGHGFWSTYYSFKDRKGGTVLFSDAGENAVGYFYYHRLSVGVDVRGVVSKKVTHPLPEVDADISHFIEGLICDKE